MKRIGIEVQRLFRQKKHGMEIVALELLKELQQLDKLNEYVLFVKEDTDKCIESAGNFRVRELKGYTYFDWEQFVLPREVRKEKVDFLHSTCNTSSLRLPVPLMLTLHDIIYLESLNFKGTAYQNFGNIYRKWVVPKVVEKSALIITVSEFEKNTIVEKLKVPEDKIKVVYNAVNKKFNNLYAEEKIALFKEKYRLPGSFILFLGNTAPKKNTANVIRAYCGYVAETADPLPLVILDYEQELVLEQLKQINRQEVFSHFIFPGFIGSDDMPLMYNAAQLFLYPSLRESFGLPILEAMGCGTPVITSNTSSMPEVGGSAAVYTDPFDPQDIAEKMSSLLGDNKRLADLSEKGIERAALFSWKESAQQLLSLYNSF